MAETRPDRAPPRSIYGPFRTRRVACIPHPRTRILSANSFSPLSQHVADAGNYLLDAEEARDANRLEPGWAVMPSAVNLEQAELIEERPDERLDTTRFEPYLRERLADELRDTAWKLSARQCGGGKANLTYRLPLRQRGFGLPRPPFG